MDKKFPINRPAHFEIHATETAKLVEFYSNVFGWKCEQWGEMDYWMVVTGTENPGINGAITKRSAPKPEVGMSPMGAVLTITVEKIDETWDKAIKSGATVAMELTDMEGVGRLGYLFDPDGNLFGLIS